MAHCDLLCSVLNMSDIHTIGTWSLILGSTFNPFTYCL